jgi:exosortase/archaeosortase family protein
MHATTFTSTAARWQHRFDRVPPLAWIALQAASLWPHWRWAAARLADGSDDPLGLAALAALACLLWHMGPRLRAAPSAGRLVVALLLTLAATSASFVAPPLVGALIAALAIAAGVRAFMPIGEPVLPLGGLAVLALPVVSSLQFYAGHPLRVLTAQLSTWGLQATGWSAERSGTAMLVEGRLIIVDAPCSGVQMVWMAYFCACLTAALCGLRDGRLLGRLPWIGIVVLAGNVLRNSVLVALEARGAVSDAVHEGVGLVALSLVCATVAWIVREARDDAA